jgi:chromosomal replication initiation ATPase DnaA
MISSSKNERLSELKAELQETVLAIREVRKKHQAIRDSIEVEFGQKYVHNSRDESRDMVDRIFNAVTMVTGVRKNQIISRDRNGPVARARHIVCYLLKLHTLYTLAEIGEIICPKKPKEHATVIHSIRIVENDYWMHNRTGATSDIYLMTEQVKDLILLI